MARSLTTTVGFVQQLNIQQTLGHVLNSFDGNLSHVYLHF